jgi:hypothetical protein
MKLVLTWIMWRSKSWGSGFQDITIRVSLYWKEILYICIPFETIDAHGLKIQGRGYLIFLPKSLVGGGSRLSGKIAWRGPPILDFIAFLLTSFSKICLGERVLLFYPPPPAPLPCVHLCLKQSILFLGLSHFSV